MMNTRPLGNTDLVVSEIGFGGLSIGGDVYGPVDDSESIDAIVRAVELGCRFFDTADTYGNGRSERLFGQVLCNRSGKIVIATKAGKASEDAFHPRGLEAALEGSLERLQVSSVDLFQLHDPTLDIIRDSNIQRAVHALKESGRIRAGGVSVVSVAHGIEAARSGVWDSIQVEANILRPEATRVLFPMAEQLGVGIIVKVPLDHGMLSGKYSVDSTFHPTDLRGHTSREEIEWRQSTLAKLGFLVEGTGRTPVQAALRYLLDQPGVSTVIPGIKTPAQAEEAMGASAVAPLNPEEMNRVQRVQSRIGAGPN